MFPALVAALTLNDLVANPAQVAQKETRSLVKLQIIALGLTLGAIVFVLLALTLIAVVPAMLDYLGLGFLERVPAQLVRWVLLLGVVIVGLAVVYRVAPDRVDAKVRWVTPGALVAAFLWLLGSIVFSLYVSFFSNYNKTYGALAEAERQTAEDTTTGEPMPMGQRGAIVADTQAQPE